ncbi:MAG: HIRAN domain-containing protein [Pseudomonadota bacterium]|nr:HIRAN domain-containing protein [Pseudomonadota bacterium]
MDRSPHIKPFTLGVVGAPYSNKDGSNRLFEIKLCSPGERVDLRPEPKNPYDEHAIAVWSVREAQIGYLSSERAPYVGGLLRAGHQLSAIFQEETDWGAAVRIGVDEEPSLLPPAAQSLQSGSRQAGDDQFWPDYLPPDD